MTLDTLSWEGGRTPFPLELLASLDSWLRVVEDGAGSMLWHFRSVWGCGKEDSLHSKVLQLFPISMQERRSLSAIQCHGSFNWAAGTRPGVRGTSVLLSPQPGSRTPLPN